MASAEARGYNGGLRAEPPEGPGAEALVESQGGAKPPLKPKVFQLSDVRWKWQNCLILPILQSQ